MSTEYGSHIPVHLRTENLQRPANIANIEALNNPIQDGINYKGRVSVIPPAFDTNFRSDNIFDTSGRMFNPFSNMKPLNPEREVIQNSPLKYCKVQIKEENEDGAENSSTEMPTPPSDNEPMDYSGGSHNDQDLSSREQCRCSKCPHVALNDEEINQHMREVHGIHKCPQCTHHFASEEELKAHLYLHIEQPVKSNRSTIKRKKSTCRHCKHVSANKEEHWIHIRQHMKPEKMLECEDCNFVTDLKHHLDYHRRNHTGSKPFKCTGCSYTCVNKSMLVSHSKSHSDVHQYRCANCEYTTKYLHSLKKHLRNEGHLPSVVLNPDGTPNPEPVVDIYGTKRGPKIKRDQDGNAILSEEAKLKQALIQQHINQTGKLPVAPMPTDESPYKRLRTLPTPETQSSPYATFPILQDSPLLSKLAQAAQSGHSYNNYKCPCGFSTENSNYFFYHLLSHQSGTHNSTPGDVSSYDSPMHNQFLPTFPPITNLWRSPISDVSGTLSFLQHLQQQQQQQKPPSLSPSTANNLSAAQLTETVHSSIDKELNEQTTIKSDRAVEVSRSRPETPEAGETSILGATVDTITDQVPHPSHLTQTPRMASPPLTTISPPSSDPSTPPQKSRRKAQPFKLTKMPLDLSADAKSPKDSSSNDQPEQTTCSSSEPSPVAADDHWDKAHKCQHCNIAFLNSSLWSLHMGYHGYNDPFACNMCGEKTNSSIEFNFHIALASHSGAPKN